MRVGYLGVVGIGLFSINALVFLNVLKGFVHQTSLTSLVTCKKIVVYLSGYILYDLVDSVY